jgi:hypothetical protein
MRRTATSPRRQGGSQRHDRLLRRPRVTRRPDFFIIGAAKSGTVSLYEYLSGHPDVYMSPRKEPGYFSPDKSAPSKRYEYGRDEARYLSLFDDARSARRAGEASTAYIVSRRAPGLIREFDPGARIIAMLRNPVDMMHSLHGQRVSMRIEEIEDFEEAMRAEEREDSGTPDQGSADTYRGRARFGEQLTRWYDAFPADQIHVIVFEEFFAHPANGFRAVLEFLGVDAGYQPGSFAVHNASHRRRRGVIGALSTSRAAHWAAHTLLPRLLGERGTARFVYRFRMSRLDKQPAPRRPMPPELRRQLEDELQPDVARLSALLGRDLGSFWFGRPAI